MALAIPLSPPAVLPVVDEIVTRGGGGGVDVDELSVGTVTAGEGGPAVADWALLAMIMSLRVRGLPLEAAAAAAGSEVLAGSEVALAISGSFLALNKRILALGWVASWVTSSLTRFNPIN